MLSAGIVSSQCRIPAFGSWYGLFSGYATACANKSCHATYHRQFQDCLIQDVPVPHPGCCFSSAIFQPKDSQQRARHRNIFLGNELSPTILPGWSGQDYFLIFGRLPQSLCVGEITTTSIHRLCSSQPMLTTQISPYVRISLTNGRCLPDSCHRQQAACRHIRRSTFLSRTKPIAVFSMMHTASMMSPPSRPPLPPWTAAHDGYITISRYKWKHSQNSCILLSFFISCQLLQIIHNYILFSCSSVDNVGC